MIADIITALAALIASISSFYAARKAKGADATAEKARAQLVPNHGSSVSDRIDLVLSMVKGQGHQIGDIRTDMADLRKDISTLQAHEMLYK